MLAQKASVRLASNCAITLPWDNSGSWRRELWKKSAAVAEYSKEPLVHRILVIHEAAGIPSELCNYMIRTLLSEGYLAYEVATSNVKTRVIKREGPTGLIIGTASSHLHPENETRMLSIWITETKEQTKAVMVAEAHEQNDDDDDLDLEEWHALQAWLAMGRTEVTIPFAKCIAKLIPPVAVRLRRDFKLLLNLIRAHALLHRQSRQLNSGGKIIAKIADYAAVRSLTRALFSEGVGASVGKTVRETVGAVRDFEQQNKCAASLSDIAKGLELDKSTVSRRACDALKDGFIQNLETRRGVPAKFVVGEPLPEQVDVLPDPEQVRACHVRALKMARQMTTPKRKRRKLP